MRLFKSNKSQASIDRLVTQSRESSPTHPEAPTYPPNQAYSGAHYSQTNNPNLPPSSTDPRIDDYEQQPQSQTHPAHTLTRSQSHRQSTAPEAFANRPTVNVIGPTSPITSTIQEDQEPYPKTQFGQQRSVHVEKEHKRSKRSIFGFSTKEKEYSAKTQGQSQVGRTGSVLRKASQNQPPEQNQLSRDEQAGQYQYPQNTARHSAYLPNQESAQQGQEQFDSQDPNDNSAQYENYYRQQQTEYESPQSAVSGYQPHDQEEAQPEYPDQLRYSTANPDNPDSYDSYHRQSQQPTPLVHDPYQQLRPPSQQSLGPSSPVLQADQGSDSRPSTATNQSRYSAQSVSIQPQPQPPPQPPPQQLMPRGDPPNGGLRQHMSQQRDPRAEDQGQAHYSTQQDPRVRMSQQVPDQGRASPAPRTREDPREMDYHTLLQKHEELQGKYSKVKRYYFERELQVTQLQNTVANQRMSMSRTSLDDAQYAARFERLNGAIRDLAFSIRKDWIAIPAWLAPVCNSDAHKVGQKEMTAIGRAYLSRWVYDIIFLSHFHPAIDMALSTQLKVIERNIRSAGQLPYMTDEQRDDLTNKITNWRLVTVEGLQDQLATGQERMSHFIATACDRLVLALKPMLADPAPPSLDSGVSMIIELAVGIASNLPIESRDVYVEYYMPGTPISETHMKMESGVPPLTQPGDHGDDDADSNGDGEGAKDPQTIENEIREASAKATAMRQGSSSDAASTGSKGDSKSKKSGGLFGGLVNKKPGPPTASAGSGIMREEMMDSNEGKIRFAAFLAVEVKGKGGKDGASGSNVLYKAPCFGYN